MVREAEGAEGARGEVFWLGCLIMVNHPDLISVLIMGIQPDLIRS